MRVPRVAAHSKLTRLPDSKRPRVVRSNVVATLWTLNESDARSVTVWHAPSMLTLSPSASPASTVEQPIVNRRPLPSGFTPWIVPISSTIPVNTSGTGQGDEGVRREGLGADVAPVSYTHLRA